MKTIPLTQGQVAFVDDADYEAVSQFKWCAKKSRQNFYAHRRIPKPDGKGTTQSMHGFLMPGVPEIDHRDGDGLNNQRGNLRAATHQQNMQGAQRKRVGATSKFRGVCWNKESGKWVAQIQLYGKKIFLGYFKDEADAARAYDLAAREYYTDGFYQLNFP